MPGPTGGNEQSELLREILRKLQESINQHEEFRTEFERTKGDVARNTLSIAKIEKFVEDTHRASHEANIKLILAEREVKDLRSSHEDRMRKQEELEREQRQNWRISVVNVVGWLIAAVALFWKRG